VRAGYPAPGGGHPGQGPPSASRAIFTPAYAVIPRDTLRDITASLLPGWPKTRCWILSRPLSGFAETFAYYLMDISPGGGSDSPEPDPGAEGVLFVVAGSGTLDIDGDPHPLGPGSFAFLPPGSRWSLWASDAEQLAVHWIRKRYEPAPGIAPPEAFVTTEQAMIPDPMPGTDGAWTTTRFVDPYDLAHDMHVNIVTFRPGAVIPFAETHVMEHGIFVLQGKGVYNLNGEWIEVEAGDYMWLRAFCPQDCYAGGPGPFRYLLYKDVNRHPSLTLR